MWRSQKNKIKSWWVTNAENKTSLESSSDDFDISHPLKLRSFSNETSNGQQATTVCAESGLSSLCQRSLSSSPLDNFIENWFPDENIFLLML